MCQENLVKGGVVVDVAKSDFHDGSLLVRGGGSWGASPVAQYHPMHVQVRHFSNATAVDKSAAPEALTLSRSTPNQ